MKRTKGDLLSNTNDVKNSKFVANNTLSIEYANGTKAIRLHDTDVVIIKGDLFTLNSGGWRTSTTKDRINRYSPARVWQDKGQWFVSDSLFYDGIVINGEGKVISKVMQADNKKVNAMKKRIANYCNLITEDNLPIPNSGDCWLCSLRDKDGHTMGENDNSHLLSHLKEKYLHGSILYNAMREAGYQDMQIGVHYSMKLADTFKRAVRRYLQKRLIKDIAVK